ncbi:MAG: hypothetical protein NVS4B2_21440 [Chloroflexota bacterium]
MVRDNESNREEPPGGETACWAHLLDEDGRMSESLPAKDAGATDGEKVRIAAPYENPEGHQ